MRNPDDNLMYAVTDVPAHKTGSRKSFRQDWLFSRHRVDPTNDLRDDHPSDATGQIAIDFKSKDGWMLVSPFHRVILARCG